MRIKRFKAISRAALLCFWVTFSGSLFFFPATLFADDLRPLYLEVEQVAEHQYDVRIKKPPKVSESNRPALVFPDHCQQLAPTTAVGLRSGITVAATASWQCLKSIGGENLVLQYPLFIVPNPAIVKVFFLSGESYTIALASGDAQWEMPRAEDISSIARQYTWLGIEHIWIGYDHLLFLLCLIWIAGTWKRILVTITGFTLAHSVTLILSALELIKLPVPPIEAVIALSVVFLATELAKGRSQSLTWKRPVTVSSSFGLLHGLGFAAVLSEIGLPQKEVVSGLLFFNVGVEIGQAVFAMVVIAIIAVAQKMAGTEMDLKQWSQRGVGYCVGCIAAYWLVQRVVGFAI
ncbi:MAG: HupE/UreJ family protein [Oceanicoccus sp.]